MKEIVKLFSAKALAPMVRFCFSLCSFSLRYAIQLNLQMSKILLAVIGIIGLVTLIAVAVSLILYPLQYGSPPQVGTLAVTALVGVLAAITGLRSAFELAVTVLAKRIQDESRWASQDRKLFVEIREILREDGSIELVRHQDYAGTFPWHGHKDLHRFAERCSHPDFVFFDKEMEVLRTRLQGEIKDFLLLLAREAFVLDANVEYARVPRDPEADPDAIQALRDFAKSEADFQQQLTARRQHLQGVRNRLNDLANSISTLYDEFVRTGRGNLGE